MRRLLVSIAFAVAAAAAAGAVPPQPAFAAGRPVHLAPADEYFGPLKISILGMRNILRDQDARFTADPSTSNAVLGMIGNVEDAIRDLERKYPEDTALPGSIYRLERLYAKLPLPAAIAKAQRAERWLFERYAKTPQAKQLQRELAEHPLPDFSARADAQVPLSVVAGDAPK